MNELTDRISIVLSEDIKNWDGLSNDILWGEKNISEENNRYMIITNLSIMNSLLEVYKFTANCYVEDNKTITLSLNEMDLVVNADSLENAKKKLAKDILEYSNEFYKDFSFWGNVPNRKNHIPYILKAIISNNVNEISKTIICYK